MHYYDHSESSNEEKQSLCSHEAHTFEEEEDKEICKIA